MRRQGVERRHLDAVRGRVMALYTMSFIGVLPLGSLVTGGVAHFVGVQPLFVASGVAYAIMGLSLKRRLPRLKQEAHPVLLAKGMLSR